MAVIANRIHLLSALLCVIALSSNVVSQSDPRNSKIPSYVLLEFSGGTVSVYLEGVSEISVLCLSPGMGSEVKSTTHPTRHTVSVEGTGTAQFGNHKFLVSSDGKVRFRGRVLNKTGESSTFVLMRDGRLKTGYIVEGL